MGSAFQTFISRLTSTLALWGLCGATIYYAFEWGLWALIHLLSLCGLYEFYKMQSGAQGPIFKKTGLLLGVLITTGTLATARSGGSDAAVTFASASVALAVLVIFTLQVFTKRDGSPSISAVSATLLGVFYVPFLSAFISALIYLTPRNPQGLLTGHFYLLYLAAVTKFSDCGAYVVGSLIGKHPMIPHISPKKTWEGFAGALLIPSLISWLMFKLLPEQLSLIGSSQRAVMVGLCIAAVAVVGDLAESLVKRATGTKDSGRFIPGIGGALDLVDSLLFTGPLLYLYLRYASVFD
jgi:phosphatidate cytidylyltransferase